MNLKKNVCLIFIFSIVALSLHTRCTRHQEQNSISSGAALKPWSPIKGVLAQDLELGSGSEARSGNRVLVHFEGFLKSGKKFSSSYENDYPLRVQIDSGKMIRGFEEGLKGMREGGKRKLSLESSVAFGERGFADIVPPHSDIEYVVRLIKVL